MSLIALLVETGQLPEPGPVVLVGLADKLNAVEGNYTSEVLFLPLRPPEGMKGLNGLPSSPLTFE